MNEIVVLSGKGGTGKTALTSSFAALTDDAVLADTDVDAANLALVLDPEPVEDASFEGMAKPVLDADLCEGCGLCRDKCRFGAIDELLNFDATACEGCGLCARICPFGAIRMEPHVAGRIFLSRTRFGSLVHARLEPGEENSGKLVTSVRRQAVAVAEAEGVDRILVDGPPGIGCPVIASLGGATFSVLVAEPGVSGMHDLDRVLALVDHFGVPAGVVVNKWDLAPENTARIRRQCEQREIPLLGEIPFDRAVIDAIVAGKPPVLGANGTVSRAIRAIWDRVLEEVEVPA